VKLFGPFRLDAANHSLWRGSEKLAITPKSFDVLRYLVENAGRLVSQNELLEALWQETYVNPEVLRKYILEIRRALGDRAGQPLYVETQPKRGYRFVAPVTDESEEPRLATPGSAKPEIATDQTSDQSLGQSSTQSPGQSPDREEFLSQDSLRVNHVIPIVITIALALIVVLAVSAYFWRGRNRTQPPARPASTASIAVLPFADLSPQHDQEYFADGLSEQLINSLTKAPGLKVVARSSAFQFKGKNEDLRSVGKQLGVANVLEGSVRKDGNRVRITAALTKVDDGFQLWSENYDREIGDLLEAQDEIARDVSSALQVKLLSPGASAAGGSLNTNPEAYQAFLQGQYFVARGQNKHDMDQALDYAAQAIKLDGNFAPAWAQRSQVLQSMATVALIENNDGFHRARESAEKAIALDPNLPTGYLTLALIQINHDWDWDGANISLDRAASLAPGNADVVGNQAYLARTLGHLDTAIELYKRATAMDPLRANFHLALGYVLCSVARYDESLAALDRAEELNPRLSSLHLTRGKVFMNQDRLPEALAEMEKETGEWEKFSGEALVYAKLGDRQASDRALKNLIATHQNDCAYQVAEAYAYRGEIDPAFRWVERSIRQRDPGAPELKTGFLMQGLRGDPRFDAMLQEMGLTR
jgi:TolB-like protein/DNA-binding winged helix-turn-helix (wHTH) protein/Tfp pilus assembly protein PilF